MHNIEQQRAIIAEHIRAEMASDIPAVVATFVPDDRAHYEVMPIGKRFHGAVGIGAFLGGMLNALPNPLIEVISEYDVPGCSIREVIVRAEHKGEYLGLSGRGNKVRIEMACFYIFDSSTGKLVSERIYFDHGAMIEQMKTG